MQILFLVSTASANSERIFYSAAEKIEKEGWIEGFELKSKGPIHFRRAL